MSRQIPAFLAFATLGALGELAVFGADVAPWVSAENFWRVDWISLLLGSLLKFAMIGEVFSRVFGAYLSISRIGRTLVTAVGAVLVLLAGFIAAFAQGDSTEGLVAGAHLIEQTVFIIESGLILFLFLFAAYFRLSWDRVSFGILVGLGISSFEHLATWAIVANASPSARARTLFAFMNMGTYHVCVLIWGYYLLVAKNVAAKPPTPPPDNNLAVWNRELERLLQQ